MRQPAGLFQSALDGLRLSLVARFAQQCKHILLVGLYTRLIEGIDFEEQTAHAAGTLKEIDELTEVILIELRHDDADVRHSAIHVSFRGRSLLSA